MSFYESAERVFNRIHREGGEPIVVFLNAEGRVSTKPLRSPRSRELFYASAFPRVVGVYDNRVELRMIEDDLLFMESQHNCITNNQRKGINK